MPHSVESCALDCSGLDRSAFDNKSVSFEEHCNLEHNMWHYLFFIILVKVKDPTEFTGPESYVYSMIQVVLNVHLLNICFLSDCCCAFVSCCSIPEGFAFSTWPNLE